MALAIDIIHGHGPSNEMHHQLQPMKTKVSVLAFNTVVQQKVSYALYIINKMEHDPFHQYNAWVWPE